MKILIWTEEEKFAKRLQRYLEKKDKYSVEHIGDGDDIFKLIAENTAEYAGAFIDLETHKDIGIKICRRLREIASFPIIVFSSSRDEYHRIAALKHGANDYVIKPVSSRMALSIINKYITPYVQSLNEAAPKTAPKILEAGPIVIHAASERAFIDDMEVNLTPKEFDLLYYFARNPERVVDRKELYEYLWNSAQPSATNIIDAHIKNLRKKLRGKHPHTVLETIHGKGYRLKKHHISQKNSAGT